MNVECAYILNEGTTVNTTHAITNHMSTANKNLLVWSNSNNRWTNASKKTKNALCFHNMPLTKT